MSVVTISFSDLISEKDLGQQISKAFGPDGLGLLTIKDIPGFSQQRQTLLPLAHRVAKLPQDVLRTLEDEESMYNAGWSFGKEKLGDKPDLAKGSFYANPIVDQAGSPEERQKYPFFYPKNRWPSDNLPELEEAFKTLGKTMYDATLLLAKHIDKYLESQLEAYEVFKLTSQLTRTQKVKGRLLYYFPTNASQEWIGWHNDSGFLTALTSSIFMDDSSGLQVSKSTVSKNGGLFIIDRNGNEVKVTIPEDEMAVQCGECLQIISGGLLVATPHCVRPSTSLDPKVHLSRGTFPVFVDCGAEASLDAPEGIDRSQVFQSTMKSRVPPLESRWTYNGMHFVSFLEDSFKKYYDWSTQSK